MYFPSSRVSPRAQVNIYVWQILHLAMTTLKHVLFIIPSPLQPLLSRNSLKKKKIKTTNTFPHQFFPRVQTLNEGHLSHLQGFKANVQSIQFFYTRKIYTHCSLSHIASFCRYSTCLSGTNRAVKLEIYGLNLAVLWARWAFLAYVLLKLSFLVPKILKTIINNLKLSLKGLF